MNDEINDFAFWVLGRQSNGLPRTGFTEDDCRERLKSIPMTQDATITDYKPKCEICGANSVYYLQDVEYYRDIKAFLVKRTVLELHFYCQEHMRETITKYVDI